MTKRIDSKHNENRHWELWKNGTGERTIEHFLGDERSTVAYMKTRKEVVRDWKVGRHYKTGEEFRYPVEKTIVRWEVYQDRWTNKLGTFKSPQEAFKTFCQNL